MNQRVCFLCLAFVWGIWGITGSLAAADPIVFNDNGGWCWYQDERVIVHDDQLIIASVANGSGTGGSSRSGDIEVVTYDLAAQTLLRSTLHDNLQADDHNTAAFLPLPDGRLLAMYSKHSGDSLIRYRMTTNPYDTTSWNAEASVSRSSSVCYSNVFRLSDEGRIYDFYRGENYNPNYIISDNHGQSWSYGGHLIRKDGHRPYLKYASNNVDTIHFIATEGHPRDYNNSIYHGFICQGGIYGSDGIKIKDLSAAPVYPEELTKVYQGGADNVAWTTDLHLDSAGNPYMIFSVQMYQDMNDLRYFYARWDGATWHVHEMAYAGSALYAAEADYSGLAALDPQNPNVVYISADVHPVTGQALISAADGQRHYEIFRGTTSNFGRDWTWEYITKNSAVDNLRPIVPIWDHPQTILLWMTGRYYTYTNYNTQIVGLFDPEPIVSNEPEILRHPNSTAAPIGREATFSVQAEGLAPLAYTWYKANPGGSDTQVGDNSDTLTLSPVQSSDLGQYYCVVSNSAGSAVSASATLMLAELSAFWPLDEAYTDVTGNGYEALPAGSFSFAAGHLGQAAVFNGSSHLNCQNSADLTLAEGGTISVWVKTSGLSTAWASVIGKGRWSWRLCRNNATDYVSFHFNSPDYEYQANGDITVVDGNWHHLAATYDGQSITLYVDGVLDASTAAAQPVNALADPVYIGSRSDAPRYWQGLIDEVRIYSFAMDEQTIELLYQQDRSCYRLDPYDFNPDCRIDLEDLNLFMQGWLDSGIDPQTSLCTASPPWDLTGPQKTPDCRVDLCDFSEMASRWMQCTLLPTSDCLDGI